MLQLRQTQVVRFQPECLILEFQKFRITFQANNKRQFEPLELVLVVYCARARVSKCFQSTDCAKVVARAKEMPRFCPRPNFLDELARKLLLRRLSVHYINTNVTMQFHSNFLHKNYFGEFLSAPFLIEPKTMFTDLIKT